MKPVPFSKLKHDGKYWMVDAEESKQETAVFCSVSLSGANGAPEIWFTGNDHPHRKQDIPRLARFYPVQVPTREQLESI